MKVLSWNILFSNQKLDEILGFLERCEADLICLQEVPTAFADTLETRWPYVARTLETHRHANGVTSRQELVILSRYEIIAQHPYTLPPRAPTPLYGRGAFRLLYILGLWNEQIGERGGLTVDVSAPGVGTLTVANAHLPLTTPADRWAALAAAHASNPTHAPDLICGDFNILESPKVSLLNWLGGGTFSDVLAWRRERVHIDQFCSAHSYVNPFAGRVTHAFSRSQLDHILVGKRLEVAGSPHIEEHRYGSDHAPISLTLRTAPVQPNHGPREDEGDRNR